MAEGEIVAVKDAVFRVQMGLLEGIQDENKLNVVASLLSRDDYQDVVTERSIAKMCGYPLCRNTLPSERPRKGNYRISLKEHKVYDLKETYMYCSPTCVINSRAFALSLQEERLSYLKPAKLTELVRQFESPSLDGSTKDPVTGINSRLSALRIHENVDPKAEELTLEDWIGPSNAIEGYIPQKDSTLNQPVGNKPDKGRKYESTPAKPRADNFFSEMDFSSTIIFDEEYSVSKTLDTKDTSSVGSRARKGKAKSKNIKDHTANVIKEQPKKQKRRAKEKVDDLSNDMNKKLLISDDPKRNSEAQVEKADHLDSTALKSSLKSSIGTKETRNVTWADEKTDGGSNNSLCDFSDGTSRAMEEDGDSSRLLSAEACARALTEAAEAVASGEPDVSSAMAEAGIFVLPPPVEGGEYNVPDTFDTDDSDSYSLKWPTKPSSSDSDLLESSDSFYDEPPEGFGLELSPFATMYEAVFTWTSASSLTYIYGHDESLYEDYMYVDGREYPRKTMLDGRSLEIKLAITGCLARALPGLVTDLRLPVPISSLETKMGHLLDTMSFMDALPPFTMKQWQLVVLLFLDALSICRIPTLLPFMTGRRTFLRRVCDGAQINTEEYEIMKDVLMPLGRTPHLARQNGA